MSSPVVIPGAPVPAPVTGDEALLSPYMTQEAEPNTAMRRTDSGGAIVRNLELIDGILLALGIKYKWPATLEDNLFLQHTVDGELVWAAAQGAPGIQGPPGEAGPTITTLPFVQITGVATKAQLPPEVAYEDEANDFGANEQTIDNLTAPNFEALMRLMAG